jgi:nucleoside-diphosphate-sugar epimerase
MKTIGITGATGFVGKRLLEYNKNKFSIVPLPLREKKPGQIDLRGIDAVIHLAGKAHDMGRVDDSVYFDINYELTKALADCAKRQDVKQFVYISSTKVYGDDVRGILDEQSVCAPTDAYGASKLKAEQYLQSISSDSFKVAIVRPPLVYGPQVKGNMIRLLHLANKNYPLPFGNSRNARSMVFIDNLIALINTIVAKGATGVFIAGDQEPVPTDKLILLIRKYLGNNKGLVSVPGIFRSIIKKVKPGLYIRLFGSFVVDNSNTNRQLSFKPPYTTEYGVEQMVKWFKETLVGNG